MIKKLLKHTTIPIALVLLTVNCLLPKITEAQLTNLYNFSGPTTDGSNPYGDLVSDGIFLYGMTAQGGINNLGTVFKIKPDGTGYSKLLDFSGSANGSNPVGSLIIDGTFLYGMTQSGGTHGDGVIFKIKPDGTMYSKLLNFNGVNGSSPQGSLISDGTFLYGMTYQGGTKRNGNIFKIKPDGSAYSNLLNFNGVNGSYPFGSLISDGTFLYGMTSFGGVDSVGNIFKIKTDGTNYVNLMEFNIANGGYPNGSLITDGTFLYGLTSYGGGIDSVGNIFKIKPDGTNFSVLMNFNGANGSHAYGSLIAKGTYLYGATSDGGKDSVGNIFKIKPDGTGYTDLIDFNDTIGSYIDGSLVADATFLYGMAFQGGTGNFGTVFKYQYCTPVTSAQSYTVCAGQSVTVGNNIHMNSGTYTDVLTSYLGCDSTVTTYLTVLSANFSQTITKCAGQSLTVGTHTYTVSGTYTDVFPGVQIGGCDSSVTTYLTILPATISQTIIKCPGQSVTVGTNTYTISGTYLDIFPGVQVNGCDSTVFTDLTILPENIFSQSLPVCPGESVTVGTHTYTLSNTYHDTLTSYQGCDSIVITNLDVSSTCATGITENNAENILNVYPNPTTGLFYIESPNPKGSNALPTAIGLNIYNVLGECIYQYISTSTNQQIDLSSQPNGVYFIQLNGEQGTANSKIVVNH